MSELILFEVQLDSNETRVLTLLLFIEIFDIYHFFSYTANCSRCEAREDHGRLNF